MTRRQRKLWTYSIGLAVGGLLLVGLSMWLEAARDTDRAEARTNVSADAKTEATASQSPIRFADLTESSGLLIEEDAPPRHHALPEDNGSGLAWGDFNADGILDLYLVRHPSIVPSHQNPHTGNRLFMGKPDGTFSDVTEEAGVADIDGFGMGATWVDYDADGNLDLYVTNRGPNRLYRNLANGRFLDVAQSAGVADPLWGTGTAWGDFDKDGHIDFYLCNYVDYDSDGNEPTTSFSSIENNYEAPYTLNPNSYDSQPNRLYRNRGDGTFEELAQECGVANPEGRSLAATFVDLDGDGWLDLYVNNDVSQNRFFRNTGIRQAPASPTVFIDLSFQSGTADPRGSMGLSVAEIGSEDGTADGLPDLFITHWLAQENALYLSSANPYGDVEYRDRIRQYRIGEISIDYVGWGCAFADLDLDGRLDIAVANGSTLEQPRSPLLLKRQPMFLFVNDGNRFKDVAPLAGTATTREYNARGLAIADYDRDGDVDIAISTNEGQVRLLRNDTPRQERQSLTVLLDANPSLCFGARIQVDIDDQSIIRWWGADVSYLSMHAPELLFGLGDKSQAEQILVQWPDGLVSSFSNVPAGIARIVRRDSAVSLEPAAD